MTAILPYPLLAVGLAFMWLALGGFTPGHLVLSVLVAVAASHALRALGEASPRVRRFAAIPELLGIVLYDIVRSNVAVALIILRGRRASRTSGFITVPIRLTNPSALAILAIVLTSTPGTAWLDYNSARRTLLVHVFDLVDEAEWIDIITNRYERLLLEIFE
ncbi:Na+/H+ antiporter subunit E [Aliihoeflea sp. 40Bstr573]|uniref:Na+/H+ antiporter subunit E n=1 Tax=Aliihoeflea sp. 40Bstr573 TaxID=2696467 RepID=UPI0020955D76|nr:Na+/H+ antiporter subunit E [Aliihoeflea sp. 40Bstr573]MCO6387413.1 Na+/H+ antiporter subunit E [Aliihoeflea sp. 40Bstr573]